MVTLNQHDKIGNDLQYIICSSIRLVKLWLNFVTPIDKEDIVDLVHVVLVKKGQPLVCCWPEFNSSIWSWICWKHWNHIQHFHTWKGGEKPQVMLMIDCIHINPKNFWFQNEIVLFVQRASRGRGWIPRRHAFAARLSDATLLQTRASRNGPTQIVEAPRCTRASRGGVRHNTLGFCNPTWRGALTLGIERNFSQAKSFHRHSRGPKNVVERHQRWGHVVELGGDLAA